MCYTYPRGAPTSACSTMVPDHGVDSADCDSNYQITADQTTFDQNGVVTSKYI